jgi:nucleotide-binding universal stress UspA family protein
MFTKLLIPLDGSGLAEQAVGRAAALARAAHAQLELLIVHQPLAHAGFPSTPWDDDNWKGDQQYVNFLAGEIASGASVPASAMILRGSAAETICQHARDVGAELIVMTTHGRTGLSRIWLGSVADAVVRLSSVPVLVLPPVRAKMSWRGTVKPFANILVPHDGSALSAAALPLAIELARLTGAEITLFRVMQPVPALIPVDSMMPTAVTPIIPDVEATARLLGDVQRETAETAARAAGDFGLSVRGVVEVGEHVSDAIVTFAHANSTDVIVMATHGRGASRWLLGSVADKVLRASGLPVVLQRPAAALVGPLLDADDVASELPALSGQ